MKKFTKMLAVTLMLSLLLTGCGKAGKDSKSGTDQQATNQENDGTADNSLKQIKDKGRLVLGLDASFPPMGFKDEDENIVGFDVDVAREVCSRMGVELTLQPISWDAKDQELYTTKIDCVWNGFTLNEEREESYKCSIPYMKNTQVVVVLADSDIQTLDDLKGKVVEIQKGSTASDAMDANKEFTDSLKELVLIGDNVKALLDLGLGCDAVVMDEVVARYYTEMKAGTYRILDESLADEVYVIGFRKGEDALCGEVEKYLKEMSEDGTLAEISQKWFKKDITIVE